MVFAKETLALKAAKASGSRGLGLGVRVQGSGFRVRV